MRTPRRIATATKLSVVCLIAAATLAQASSAYRAHHDGASVATPAMSAAFRVRGNVKGLYPGLKKPLKVRVTNAGHRRIQLITLKVVVRSTTVGCPSASVKVKPFRGHRAIRARASISLKLPARMKRSAPDACQGARYRLTYKGKAT